MMLIHSPSYLNLYLTLFKSRLGIICNPQSSGCKPCHTSSLQFDKHQQGPTTDPTLAPHLLQSHPRHLLLCTPKGGTASYQTMSKKSGNIAEQLCPSKMFPSLSATSVLLRHVGSHLLPQRQRPPTSQVHRVLRIHTDIDWIWHLYPLLRQE